MSAQDKAAALIKEDPLYGKLRYSRLPVVNISGEKKKEELKQKYDKSKKTDYERYVPTGGNDIPVVAE